MSVPRVPAVSTELDARYRAAHRSLALAMGSAAPEAIGLFRFLQHRLVVESLADVQPVLSRPLAQLLRPPPRAFLTRHNSCVCSELTPRVRHLDSRVAMRQQGMVPTVVCETTPIASHALFEGVAPSGRETNPGMFRTTPTSWRPEANAFAHPESNQRATLVGEAITTANDADAPAFVRAAWLTFTMLCIHPFVDGNGRTSRQRCTWGWRGRSRARDRLGHHRAVVGRGEPIRRGAPGGPTARALTTRSGSTRRPSSSSAPAPKRRSSGPSSAATASEAVRGRAVGLQQLGLSTDAATVLVAVRAAVDACSGNSPAPCQLRCRTDWG